MNASLVARQRRLFALVEEFFRRVTGEDVTSFAARGDFSHVIHQRASVIAQRGEESFAWFESEARTLYTEEWKALFSDARDAGGMKLVLGGASQLSATHLASIRKMLLYSDTILIPDPLLPWLETDRQEERFRYVTLLQQAFWLLHLKPLIDEDLPYPAILVFPSWEKGLEENDPTTQEGQLSLTTAVVGHHIGHRFDNLNELRDFASAQPDSFLAAVEKNNLFLAPGALAPEPLEAGLARYWTYARQWRSADFIRGLASLPTAHLLLYAIMERLGPQYHMMENAEELSAQPMMCVDAHWHYHKLIGDTFASTLADTGALSPATIAILRALNRPGVSWLGNVPMSSLVTLRKNNENEAFRRRLSEYTAQLRDADLNNLDRVAADIGRGIAGLLTEHNKEVTRIAETYKLTYLRTLGGGVITAAALFAPALAPIVGALYAPLALAGAYANTKQQELLDKRRASRSLVGILATARDTARS
jgi:hypothetical protein